MLHSSATPGFSSYGDIPSRTKHLPHIGTMMKPTPALQSHRPSAAEAIIQTIAATVDDTSGSKSHSRNIRGLFSRNKEDGGVSSAGRYSTSSALRSAQDKSKRTNQLNKGQTQPCQEHLITYSKALAKVFKQITLDVPTMDADSLLRLAHSRHEAQRASLEDADPNDSKRRILEEAPMYWTTSTFILTDDAILYQYPATGSSRRLPDRFLQLTDASAAFASDVLPGKHWVLRITQSFGQIPTLPASKSRFSKLGLRSAKEETLNNILLVMESAEEMNSWQTAVKDVIASQVAKAPQIHRERMQTSSIGVHELSAHYSPRSSMQKDTQSLRRAIPAMPISNVPSRKSSVAKPYVPASLSEADTPCELPNNELQPPTVETATEDLSRLVLQLDGDDTSSDSSSQSSPDTSPIQDDSEQSLPQWDLPVSIGPGLSLASPMISSFPKAHQRTLSEDLSSQNRLSLSMASVGTRQSSVPSLSYRFSQSTRAGTIIETPPQSTRSSMCAPSATQCTNDLLGRRGAASLPFILTDPGSRAADEYQGMDLGQSYQAISEIEEVAAPPLDGSPKIPKRYSSLNMIRQEDWEDVGDSKETYPPMLNPRKRLSSLIPDGSALILSPRALSITNPGSPRIVSTNKKSPVSAPVAEFHESPIPTTVRSPLSLGPRVSAEEPIPSSGLRLHLNPLPADTASNAAYPASAPPTQLTFGFTNSSMSPPIVSKFNTSFRPSSSQGSSSFHRLHNKSSLISLIQSSTSKAISPLEPRSIPPHLLGPPTPPPNRSLPAVPGAVLTC